MIKFPTTFYIYVDRLALQDEGMDILLSYFAQKHKEIRLFVSNAWDLPEIKQHEHHDYICEEVYGNTMVDAILKTMDSRKQKETMVFVIGYEDLSKFHGTGVQTVQLKEGTKYENTAAFYFDFQASLKKSKMIYCSIMIACMVYFGIYFCSLEVMPDVMLEGWIAYLFVLVPAMIMVLATMNAMRKGYLLAWEVLDLFT